jgi:hypothetical protein
MTAAMHVNGLAKNPSGSAPASSSPARTPRSTTPGMGTHVSVSGNSTTNNKSHKIKEHKGYKDTSFHGKEDQLQLVIKTLLSKGFIPPDLVENEVYQLPGHEAD